MKKKWKREMSSRAKRLALMLTIAFSCLWPQEGFSQDGQEMQVKYTVKSGTIESIFRQLRKQGGYEFFYDAKVLDATRTVTLTQESGTLDEILRETLGERYEWRLQDNYVLISLRKEERPVVVSLMLKGFVRDEKRQPLPYVTVSLEDASVGTATDERGWFSLRLPVERGRLLFSFVGYKKEVMDFTSEMEKDTLYITLKEELQAIDEVVVTGYQTISSRDVVGAYTTMKAEDVIMPSYNSIDQMLQGQIAGLMVINSSSRVGTSPRIRLRGTSTLLGNQAPLWVVDGIIQEDPLELDASLLMTQDLRDVIGSQVSWLNPMDIETITVLKDASATAIYGSKASNGVIVITTKKGEVGRLTVNYTGNLTINTRPNYDMFNYMNSKERVQFSREAFKNGTNYQYEPIAQPYTFEGALKMYLEGGMSQTEFAERAAFLESVNTDWFDLLTRSGVSHSHNLSVFGGTENVTYNVSVGYNNSLGQEIGNDSERMTARLATNIRLHEKVRLDATINVSTTTTNTFGDGVNPMGYATETSRALPAYDEEGEAVFYQRRPTYRYSYNGVNSLSFNFINERDNTGAKNENSYFSTNLNFRWNILDWLIYEFTGGYTMNITNAESWSTERTFAVAQQYRGYDYGSVEPGSSDFYSAQLPFGGVLYTSNATQKSYNIQNKLLFSKEFNADHRLNVMLAMEVRSSTTRNNINTVWGYMPDRGESLVKPTSPSEFEGVFSGWGILDGIYDGGWNRTNNTDNYFSYFATLAYSLKNRYVFNFSIRNDESNRFGQDVNHRFDPTYSFGLSWTVTEEPWMQGIMQWVNALDVRVTYGIQGNAMTRIGPELVLTQMGIEDVYNDYSSTISRLPNPNLSWERTKSWDFGLNLRLFNRFDVVFDYYTRESNVVVEQELSYEYGIPTMQMNGGKITNRGVECTLSFTPVAREDWALNLSLNSSKNWNKTGEAEFDPYREELLNGSYDKVLVKGYPVGGFWSYSFAGLSAEDGHPLFNYMNIPEENVNSNVDPLSFLVYSGTSEPNFTGGLSFSLRYKNVTLSSGLSLLLGGKKRLPSPYSNMTYGMQEPDKNLSRNLLKRWRQSGDESQTNIPALPTDRASQLVLLPDGSEELGITLWEQSDVMVADASFLRCRQLSLSYRLGDSSCAKLRLKSLALSLTVANLFVIANERFNGFDPELGDSVYPKNYSIGINVGF